MIKCLPSFIMANKVAVKWMLMISSHSFCVAVSVVVLLFHSLSLALSFSFYLSVCACVSCALALALWLFYWQSRCVISNIMQVTTHQIGNKPFYNKYYMHSTFIDRLQQTTLLGLLCYSLRIILPENCAKAFLQLLIPQISVAKMPFVNKIMSALNHYTVYCILFQPTQYGKHTQTHTHINAKEYHFWFVYSKFFMDVEWPRSFIDWCHRERKSNIFSILSVITSKMLHKHSIEHHFSMLQLLNIIKNCLFIVNCA